MLFQAFPLFDGSIAAVCDNFVLKDMKMSQVLSDGLRGAVKRLVDAWNRKDEYTNHIRSGSLPRICGLESTGWLTNFFSILTLCAVTLFSTVVSAQGTPPYPVIFVHGLNSSGADFQSMIGSLDSTGVLTGGRLLAWTTPSGTTPCNWSDDWGKSPQWKPVAGVGVPALKRYFAIDFSSNNNLTLNAQGKELKQVIDCVKAITSTPQNPTTKVILVAHSMGGLAARAYLQGRAMNAAGSTRYESDVAKLITVGTPHQGSPLADFCVSIVLSALAGPTCQVFTRNLPYSVATYSLQPASAQLSMLNDWVDLSPNNLPPEVSYTSITVKGAFVAHTGDGDGIVTEISQNLASLWAPLNPPSTIAHKPISVTISVLDCYEALGLETHTCETKNSTIQGFVSSEISSTSLATPAAVIPPVATTLPPTSATISGSSATVNGSINPSGKSATAWFKWGPSLAMGNITPQPAQSLAAGFSAVPISATLYGLASGQTYYYQAMAQNSDGVSRPSTVLQFTTPAVGVSSLPAPSLFSPGPYAWSQSTTPHFSWSPVTNAASYRIMVAADPSALQTDKSSASCPACVINITGPTASYDAPAGTLAAGTVYWWQVKGRGVTEYGDWSTVGVFATALAATVPLPAPTLTGPINGTTTASATPLMSWTPVSGANSYWIMVATNPANLPAQANSLTCALCSVNDIAYVNSYTPSSNTLVPGVTYYWQVKASSATTTAGAWSSPIGVFVAGGSPPPSRPSCGASAGGTFTSEPTSNLCTIGTQSAVTGVYSWFWSCTANGYTQNCAANKQTYTVSTTVAGNGTVTPSSQDVVVGFGAAVTVTPSIGFKATVAGCGISQSWIGSPTIVPIQGITASCVVTVAFTPNPATRFSKICNNGQDAGQGSCPAEPVLGTGVADWACTRDNNNGLLWEVKTNDRGLRDSYNTYTWYDANPANNGGIPGTKNGGVCVGSGCDTSGFADAVSATGLCGANDWRMPTHDELVTLVDANSANNGQPAIDGSYFPNTSEAPYWSGSPYAGDSNAAWYMNFNRNYGDGTEARLWDHRVRLVRGRAIGGPFGLTVSITGSGSVTSSPAGINCGSTCAESVPGGTSVTLTATPNAGYSFGGWGGACTGTDTTCTVAMSQYRDVVATFSSLAVNGTCGGANGSTYPIAPIGSLCSTGTPGAMSGSGPWYWSCLGSGGGATASCSAYPAGTTLPSVPITGYGSTISAGAMPYGIATGPDGNVWFTEGSGNRIGRITPAGVVTEFSAGITANAGLRGITAGPDGNLWFTEAGPDRIGRITPTGVVTEFNVTPGATPIRIVAGPDGNLWYTEMGLAQIGRITPAGVVTEFSAGISAQGYAQDITAGPDGNLWFTEYSLNRIGRITPTGVVTEFSGGISPGAGPMGIAAGPDGNVWFTESGGSRIGRITPAGVVTEFSAGILANSGSYTITAGSDGNLWFPQVGSSPEIGRITPAGVVTEFNSANANVTSITAGPDGNLWFAASAQNLIGRIDISGNSAGATAVSLGTVLPFSAQVGATSAAQSVTLSNTGSALLNIASIVAHGDFAQSNGCGTTLAAGTSCTISVTFTPTAAGPRNGNLTMTSNAIGSPHVVSLNGTGMALTLPGAPTAASATAGDAQATVSFTAPTNSVITGYTVNANPAGGVDINAGTTALNHTVTGLTNGTSYTFTVTAANTTGTGAVSVASNSVTPKGNQTIGTISFSPTTLAIGATTTASATASSGLTVSFSSNATPTVCSVSGSTVTGVNAGTCTIAANQAGNATYSGAPQVTQSIAVTVASTGTLITRYRLYSDLTKEHLYTTDSNEYSVLPVCCGWLAEGAIYKLFQAAGSLSGVAAVPYYRLYNPLSYQHHWTTDLNEYNVLGTLGWSKEGIDGYILPTAVTGSLPLYRLYLNAFGGLHLWTVDANEKTVLTTTAGWVNEGVAGYVSPLP